MSLAIIFEDHGWTAFAPLLAWHCLPELVWGSESLLSRHERAQGGEQAALMVRPGMEVVARERLERATCAAPSNGSVLVNARWLGALPDRRGAAPAVAKSGCDVAWIRCDAGLAARLTPEVMLDSQRLDATLSGVPAVEARGAWLSGPWDLIRELGPALLDAWEFRDAAGAASPPCFVHLQCPERIHADRSTVFQGPCVLDARGGPIRVERDVSLGAFCVIEGPCFIGHGTRLNPHAWLHGANSIGPLCKLGGEIDGCILQGYSNKQHAGFLGHAYVGSWVNLGAGTTNSDLKNTYGNVRVRVGGKDVDTGSPFFGAIIGDHAKLGINTALPTGATVGFAAQAATGGLIPKSVAAMTRLGEGGATAGDPVRLLRTAEKVMARRGVEMSAAERELFLRAG